MCGILQSLLLSCAKSSAMLLISMDPSFLISKMLSKVYFSFKHAYDDVSVEVNNQIKKFLNSI